MNNDIRTYINLIEQKRDQIAEINSASEEEQIAIVSDPISHRFSYNIFEYINNPSEAVQLAAVRENGLLIMHIPNPSEAVQLAAVQRNGEALELIKNPSEAVQIAAVEENPFMLYLIRDELPKEVIIRAILQLIRQLAGPSSEDHYYDLVDAIKDAIRKYSKKYPEWEEWPTIKKAYKEFKDSYWNH